ncbi:phosphatidylserine/phosphatidylglycerophosphate/cardiolipin synthase family protein [Bradyrhizobium sp. Ash2021]|uniref:phosphatidylserine/phosphatidylglycerophosphate/ cardiolipin synthase family protein n=1 Tax=Bradyrhizobium sp. Ash2021 TaxID=2954771 RepID=UPI002814C69A|nr:phosphatidylserine/phosphatidylglycerophosphate/cardiolipin synthase family protein [Bradyrhizobium sp. Ash2021]WMT71061.1 phosphatidylserine/phosphatidylglycerophosphate/cardiolipin synthase family protein [Bradyrhizobium sp. Ash2021]
MVSKFPPEELYRRIGRIIEECPSFAGISNLSADQLTWLGRAEALIAVCGDMLIQAEFAAARATLAQSTMRQSGFQDLMMALYRALAKAELAAPAGAQGAFIPVGGSFDAYAALAKVFSQAQFDLLVVDPYMDDSVLLEFGGAVPETVTLRLLSDQATAKQSLEPAAKRWKAQYPNRSLQVRLTPARGLHDRVILVDGKEAWTITQSLKDLAKRSPAEIVRANDIAALKITAYEQIWTTAGVLV